MKKLQKTGVTFLLATFCVLFAINSVFAYPSNVSHSDSQQSTFQQKQPIATFFLEENNSLQISSVAFDDVLLSSFFQTSGNGFSYVSIKKDSGKFTFSHQTDVRKQIETTLFPFHFFW